MSNSDTDILTQSIYRTVVSALDCAKLIRATEPLEYVRLMALIADEATSRADDARGDIDGPREECPDCLGDRFTREGSLCSTCKGEGDLGEEDDAWVCGIGPEVE